eukprot:768455-Hanusia_phi.AAC.11
MAMDQILFPPVITAFTFFMLTMIEGVLSGFSLTMNKGFQQTAGVQQSISQLADHAVSKVKHDLVPTLITNYKVWPAVQILNFSIVPVKLQVRAFSSSSADIRILTTERSLVELCAVNDSALLELRMMNRNAQIGAVLHF